jgi:hypothetical protein
MRLGVTALLAAACLVAAKDNSVAPQEAADGWILLFDGESSFGWMQAGSRWRAAVGTLTFDGTDSAAIRTGVPFGDFTLRFDFRAGAVDKGAALLIRFAKDKSPRESGYEIPLDSVDPKWPAGSIVEVAKSDGPNPAANQWHTAELAASGDQLSFKLDGRNVAEGKDPKSKAGYIGFEAKSGAPVQLRNVKLKPSGMNALFNGADLSGWRPVSPPPPKPGMLKKVIKVGGGKPKETQWGVRSALIHGEGAPGELESSTLYDDFILQVQGRAAGAGKKPKSSVYLRGDAGQLFSGYEISFDGAVVGFRDPRTRPQPGELVVQTIAACGRHFEIWVNGYPVNEFDDTRPDASLVPKGAKTAAGAVGLAAGSDSKVDFGAVRVAALPKTLGGERGRVAVAAPPPPVAPPPAPAVAPAAAASAPPPVVIPPELLAKQKQDDEQKKQSAKLMTEALQSKEPAVQMRKYEAILQIDPANVAAMNGYNKAKDDLEKAQAEQKQEDTAKASKEQQAARNEADGHAALARADQAFFNRDLRTAESQLAIAERLLPGNPAAQKLRATMNNYLSWRQRLTYFATGAGAVALVAAVILFWKRRGKKQPFIEVIDGFDKGKRFDLSPEVCHIGAVAQDGGARNDVVIRDVERMISRFHCEIHNQKGRLFLVDCHSANGTSVNGKRLAPGQPVRLKNGSRVMLARTCTLQVGFEKLKKQPA